MTYTPRNRNEKTHEAPKSTARWFDDRRAVPRHPVGFHAPKESKPC
jgi:hypothetical protein